jgi:hypothetical protein
MVSNIFVYIFVAVCIAILIITLFNPRIRK